MELNTIHQGNCLDILPTFDSNIFDTIITDPPYELGFMGKSWDKSGIAFNTQVWKECLRVAKPGATLLAFGGSRTFHRIAVAIEDAGWVLKDTIMWVYGSGFPKSLNIGKAVYKLQGNEREVVGKSLHFDKYNSPNYVKNNAVEYVGRKTKEEVGYLTKGTSEWEGWGTALKPAFEPIIMALKPNDGSYSQNALKWGVGGINIDESRISGRFPANLIHDGSEEVIGLFPNTKPTKPHGGDGSRLDTQNMGWGFKRMPCKLLEDKGGSAARFFYCAKASRSERNRGCEGLEEKETKRYGDFDGTQEHAPKKDVMNTNNHPTVKPIKLMEYLCTLTKTPTGGIVLDPFAGSGTTLMAAKNVGRSYVGIELIPEYVEIAKARISSLPERLL